MSGNILKLARWPSFGGPSLRAYSSALFPVTAIPDGQRHVAVKPNIDLESRLKNMERLTENLELRKIAMEPLKIQSLWELFKNLETTKLQLEKRRLEITDRMKDLKQLGKDDDVEVKREMEKLKVEGRVVRTDLKSLLRAFLEIEEKIVMKAISLPNELHENTPKTSDKVAHEFKSQPHVATPTGHIDLGRRLNLLDYRHPSCYYLKNAGVAFELGLIGMVTEHLKADNFIPFCNPDFARSVLVEGCGSDYTDPDAVFTLKEDDVDGNHRMHLVGGASVFPFCAFHSRHSVSAEELPLKYFAAGRQYTPGGTKEDGLFGCWQKSCVEVCGLTPDDPQSLQELFEHTFASVVAFYERLHYHFRVVRVHAAALKRWETFRAVFQMFSCAQQKYIEVGNLSISDTYICNRMEISYRQTTDQQNREVKTPRMLSGTILNVPAVLGCMLEQNQEAFQVPECLKPHTLGLA